MQEMTQQISITQEIVDYPERDNFLFKHTDKACLRFENLCYVLADKFLDEYNGGMWEFIELSNGGFFIVPKDKEHYTLSNPIGVCEKVKNQVAGIFITIYALCELINSYTKTGEHLVADKLLGKYGELLNYCYGRLDYPIIKKFLD